MKAKIAVVLSLLAVAGCSDENSKLRGQFISGCIQGGGNKPICACTFKKLEEKYSPDELKDLNTPYKAPPDDFMQDVVQFALACRSE